MKKKKKAGPRQCPAHSFWWWRWQRWWWWKASGGQSQCWEGTKPGWEPSLPFLQNILKLSGDENPVRLGDVYSRLKISAENGAGTHPGQDVGGRARQDQRRLHPRPPWDRQQATPPPLCLLFPPKPPLHQTSKNPEDIVGGGAKRRL